MTIINNYSLIHFFSHWFAQTDSIKTDNGTVFLVMVLHYSIHCVGNIIYPTFLELGLTDVDAEQ